jgi:hypothetical protein
MDKAQRQREVKILRWTRWLHGWMGILLFLLFLLVASTGLLLAWKKNSGGYILAATTRGSSTELADWRPLSELTQLATTYLRDSVAADLDPTLDRIDVRPDKGVVKISFENHYWGLQLDGATGALLSVERRRSDFIEQLHDGSILDRQLTTAGWIKLVYSSITGTALLLFSITGFWLWYGPRRLRRERRG